METAVINPEYLLKVARDTINAVQYCFLITISESGKQANARLVQHRKPEEDWTLWICTSSKSRKVKEILHENHITVTFQDDREYAYITMLGSASVEDDLQLKQRHWQDDLIVYFPEGSTGEDYVLIKFVPSRIEIMNFAHKITPEPYGLRPAILVRLAEDWAIANY
ncbi:MAG: pyridoxamine 5'-phosphate oxidase family protein [Hydrococcus sp. RM1_1_31]|nr:pyridoxamine 5'-phosphate oxidase family protein [Hydrococcus sp. RM1_1_31]